MKLTRILANYTGGLSYIDTTQIWVSKSGSDSSGDGTATAPYLTITKALASVTSARKTIIVLPGIYAEVAALVWPLIEGVCMVGIGLVTITAVGTTTVLTIAPGAITSTFDVRIENIDIDHANSSQDGITINNTGCGMKINLTLCNVSGDCDDGDMIATVHGDASNAIRIYWDGDHGEGVAGSVHFTGGNNGDRLYITGCSLDGGIVTSDTAVALDVVIRECLLPHAGITGGASQQTVKIVGCYSNNSGTYAAADTGECTGNQTCTAV